MAKSKGDDEHVCDGGPERHEASGDPQYVMVRRYCTTCGGMTSSETRRVADPR